jgi:chromosome partitioning protein
MRRIAVLNQKGGVGKTTTAVNLAAAIAEAGFRVCLIDLDPQAHASLHLGVSATEEQPTIYEVFCSQARLVDVRQWVNPQLAVIPATLDLAAAEMELASEVGREIILKEALEADEEDFDFIIIDCPPSLNVLTLNALTVVHEVFLPLQPHFLALHGLSKLLRTIEVVAKRLNPTLRLSGIVLCMYESSTRLAAEVTRDVQDFFQSHAGQTGVWSGARFFETKIRRNIRLAEAPSFGQSIFAYAPHSHGAEDYRQLAMEVMGESAVASLLDGLSVPLVASA